MAHPETAYFGQKYLPRKVQTGFSMVSKGTERIHIDIRSKAESLWSVYGRVDEGASTYA